jgi:hypothetical protein
MHKAENLATIYAAIDAGMVAQQTGPASYRLSEFAKRGLLAGTIRPK